MSAEGRELRLRVEVATERLKRGARTLEAAIVDFEDACRETRRSLIALREELAAAERKFLSRLDRLELERGRRPSKRTNGWNNPPLL